MTSNQSPRKISDIALDNEKITSMFVDDQFPGIYREQGQELVDLVKSYYRFLEESDVQSVYNIRRIYDYRDIDSTLDRMLVFFKKKFLNGLFFDEDTRFVVKNILDLYRRRGSVEGIELFFKLFFDTEVSIYFPSQDMVKPSTSIWKTGSFLQMFSTNDLSIFDGIINLKIFGDKSNASAFVDSVYFVNIKGAYVPILFLSDVKGQFIGFDVIYSLEPSVSYGMVYGSLREVEIDKTRPVSGGNKVGDKVEIMSSTGRGAKGRITDVTRDLSGEIIFTIEDGNYGYTTTNTTILISDQSCFFPTNDAVVFEVNETVKQITSSNTEVFGVVVGKTNNSLGVSLDFTQLNQQDLIIPTTGEEFNPNEVITQRNEFGIDVFGTIIDEQENRITVQLDRSRPDANNQRYLFRPNRSITTIDRVTNITKAVTSVIDDYFFEGATAIETVSRETNISRAPVFITNRNLSARADIGTIKNTETIRIITDTIENYLNVSLDSSNYSLVPPALIEMSGTRLNSVIPTRNTPLNEAFVPETFVIGEIDTLKNVNPGFGHVSDVFVLARENLFRRFNLRNQILTVSTTVGVVLLEGDIVTQTKTVQDFEGNTSQTTVRGRIVAIQGDNITVKQLTFESFVTGVPMFKTGSTLPITVVARTRDQLSLPLGMNAIIDGDVEIVTGKILKIDVIDSGIGYEDGKEVEIINTDKTGNTEVVDAFGFAKSRGQGITEGRWRSFTSHPNQEKVIQDSFFYQDYSYQITTDLETEIYETEYRKNVHPAGIKLFAVFGKIEVINIDVEVTVARADRMMINDSIELIDEQDGTSILSESGFQYLVSSIVEGNEQ
jgi:hypothetical protein